MFFGFRTTTIDGFNIPESYAIANATQIEDESGNAYRHDITLGIVIAVLPENNCLDPNGDSLNSEIRV